MFNLHLKLFKTFLFANFYLANFGFTLYWFLNLISNEVGKKNPLCYFFSFWFKLNQGNQKVDKKCRHSLLNDVFSDAYYFISYYQLTFLIYFDQSFTNTPHQVFLSYPDLIKLLINSKSRYLLLHLHLKRLPLHNNAASYLFVNIFVFI